MQGAGLRMREAGLRMRGAGLRTQEAGLRLRPPGGARGSAEGPMVSPALPRPEGAPWRLYKITLNCKSASDPSFAGVALGIMILCLKHSHAPVPHPAGRIGARRGWLSSL